MKLGVGPQQQCFDPVGWVKDHHQKLSFACGLASQNMAKAASLNKQGYDRKAHALPLAPGERVWVKDRNRQYQGKIHPGWGPEPHVVLEQLGGTRVVGV